MATEINFLSKQRQKVTKQKTRDFFLYRIFLSVFGVVATVSLLVVAASLFLSFSGGRVEARRQELEESVLFQEEVEESIIVIAKKLDILDTLLNQRQNKQDALDYFLTLFGPGVLLKEIDYEAGAGILSLRVQTASVFEFERINDLIESDQTKTKFPQINKSELRRDPDGTYSVTITVVLGDKD